MECGYSLVEQGGKIYCLSSLFELLCAIHLKYLAPVVQKVDSGTHWINHYPLDNSIGFDSVHPLDSDLSGG